MRQLDAAQQSAGERVVQAQPRGAAHVRHDQQRAAIRRKRAAHIVLGVGDQLAPLTRRRVELEHGDELAVPVGVDDQGSAVRPPLRLGVLRVLVRAGQLPHLAARAAEAEQLVGRRPHAADREHAVHLPGHDGRGHDGAAPVVRDRLGAVGTRAQHDVEVHAVAPIGQVDEPPLFDADQTMDIPLVPDQRLEPVQPDRLHGQWVQPQHGQLRPLVAPVVVLHDHRALAAQITPGTRPGKRCQRRHAPVRSELHELQ